MNTALLLNDPVTPTPEESELAQESGRRLAEFLEQSLPIQVEGEEIFRLGPIVDLVRSGELSGNSGS